MWTLAAEHDLIRTVWSLDYDDMLSLLGVIGVLLGVVLVRRAQSQLQSANQVREVVQTG